MLAESIPRMGNGCGRLPTLSAMTRCNTAKKSIMHQIFYIVGPVVLVMAVLAFVGLR